MDEKFVKLKVYLNKSNNQSYIVLPKKRLKKIPDFVEVKGGCFK